MRYESIQDNIGSYKPKIIKDLISIVWWTWLNDLVMSVWISYTGILGYDYGIYQICTRIKKKKIKLYCK